MRRLFFGAVLTVCWVTMAFTSVVALDHSTQVYDDAEVSALEAIEAFERATSAQGRRSLDYVDPGTGIWVSENPADLRPLGGTTWDFTYTLNGRRVTDRISIDNKILRDPTTNAVYLSCQDQKGRSGALLYHEVPGRGRAYAVTFVAGPNYNFYRFTVNGNTAGGRYIVQSQEAIVLKEGVPMSGKKVTAAAPPSSDGGGGGSGCFIGAAGLFTE